MPRSVFFIEFLIYGIFGNFLSLLEPNRSILKAFHQSFTDVLRIDIKY
jgi:hypothetical protein